MFGEKWNSFLQTDFGQQLVPDWRRHLTNAEIYFSNESVNDDFEDTIDTNDFSREDWMYLAELSNTQVATEDKAVDEQCHQKFSEEEINSMPSWLINAKKIVETSTEECQNGGISVTLVGDIPQLRSVMDKALHHKQPDEENDQKRFHQLLLKLRNGDSTEYHWDLLLARTADSIGNQKDTDEYVKLSFSNQKIASDNFEVLQSLNVPIAQ